MSKDISDNALTPLGGAGGVDDAAKAVLAEAEEYGWRIEYELAHFLAEAAIRASERRAVEALQAIVAREQRVRPCRVKPDGCGECAECIAVFALRAAAGARPPEPDDPMIESAEDAIFDGCEHSEDGICAECYRKRVGPPEDGATDTNPFVDIIESLRSDIQRSGSAVLSDSEARCAVFALGAALDAMRSVRASVGAAAAPDGVFGESEADKLRSVALRESLDGCAEKVAALSTSLRRALDAANELERMITHSEGNQADWMLGAQNVVWCLRRLSGATRQTQEDGR